MDVDGLRAGQRFDVELAKALDACDVFLAVIGPHWMDLLRQRHADLVGGPQSGALRRRKHSSCEPHARSQTLVLAGTLLALVLAAIFRAAPEQNHAAKGQGATSASPRWRRAL